MKETYSFIDPANQSHPIVNWVANWLLRMCCKVGDALTTAVRIFHPRGNSGQWREGALRGREVPRGGSVERPNKRQRCVRLRLYVCVGGWVGWSVCRRVLACARRCRVPQQTAAVWTRCMCSWEWMDGGGCGCVCVCDVWVACSRRCWSPQQMPAVYVCVYVSEVGWVRAWVGGWVRVHECACVGMYVGLIICVCLVCRGERCGFVCL